MTTDDGAPGREPTGEYAPDDHEENARSTTGATALTADATVAARAGGRR